VKISKPEVTVFDETDLFSSRQNLGNMESFPSKGHQALGRSEQMVIPVRDLFSSKSSTFQIFQAVWMKISVYLKMHRVLRLGSP